MYKDADLTCFALLTLHSEYPSKMFVNFIFLFALCCLPHYILGKYNYVRPCTDFIVTQILTWCL